MYGSRYEVARKLWTCLVLASVGLLSNPLTAQDPPAEKRATDDPYFSSSAAPESPNRHRPLWMSMADTTSR